MPAEDRTRGGIGEPASHAFQIIPSDSEELAIVTRAIYVGGAGNIYVTMAGGETVPLIGAAAGSVLPFRVRRVLSTGTTATSLIGLY